MSMIGNFRRVSSARVESLEREPASVGDYLDGEDEDDETHADREDEDQDQDQDADTDLDVDKAWHGIHFLLTGTAWEGESPLAFIVRGGRELGDVGYGPARLFTSDEVKAIAGALRPLTREVLAARFEPKTMTRLEIYPAIWDRSAEEEDTLEYLLSNYEALQEFIAGAAEKGEGLVVYVA